MYSVYFVMADGNHKNHKTTKPSTVKDLLNAAIQAGVRAYVVLKGVTIART